MREQKNKLGPLKKTPVLVILGPTASGKTALAVRLAARFKGEIISADSRQVYRGLDIGTGKDLAEYKVGRQNIPYHLIDVAEPTADFNLAQYQKLAKETLKKITARGHLAIIVGGTGLYLQALVDNYRLASGSPDLNKRRELEALSAADLFKLLEKLKPEFAAGLNNSDKNNPRRLVRYLEIILSGQKIQKPRRQNNLDFLILGLRQEDEEMRRRIKHRIVSRLDKEDMVGEVERLVSGGLSYARLHSLGLEYRYIAWYLQDKLSYEEMIEGLTQATYRFAKRQKTWFKRWEKQGKIINWLEAGDKLKEANKLIDKWLKNA